MVGCCEEQPQISDNMPAQKLLGPSGSTTPDLPDPVPPDSSLVSLKEQSDDTENQLDSTNQKTANTCSYRQGLFKDNGGGNKEDEEEQTTSTFSSLTEEVITTEEEDSQEFSETIEDEIIRSESDQSTEDNEPPTDPKICVEDNGSESSEVDSSIPPTFNYSHESKDIKEFPDTYMYQDPLELNIEGEFCEENQNIDEDTRSTNEEEGVSTGTVKHQVPATLETVEQGNSPTYRCDLYEEAAINEVEDVVNSTNSKNETRSWSERDDDCIIAHDPMNSQSDDETVSCFLTSPKLEQFLDLQHKEIVVGPSFPHEGK